MSVDRDFLDELALVAIDAGRAILAVYGTAFDVGYKGDASPVTEADHRAEALILEKLPHIAPDLVVVAEEACSARGTPDVVGRRFFLVDPLDGTREFASRNGEFTVNIAVVEDGVPVAGVVVAPAIGEAFLGARGLGATAARVEGLGLADARPIRVRSPAASGFAVLASRSHAGPETEAFLARLPVASRVAAGSSLKFCRLAEGAADLYPRLGPTMEWDTAAGDAVLRAAGGQVVTFDGAPLLYGKQAADRRRDFLNPDFLAVGGVDPAAVLARARR